MAFAVLPNLSLGSMVLPNNFIIYIKTRQPCMSSNSERRQMGKLGGEGRLDATYTSLGSAKDCLQY